MVRLFKHYVSQRVIMLAAVDALLLMVAAELAWVLRAGQIDMMVEPLSGRFEPILTYAVTVQVAMIAVGAYSPESIRSFRLGLMRLLTAVSFGVILLALLNFITPGVTLWRSNLVYAMPLTIILLGLLRIAAAPLLRGKAFRRRIAVMGAGQRAARIAALSQRKEAGFDVAAFIAMSDRTPQVAESVHRSAIDNLPDFLASRDVVELVLALEERRNALPLSDLLRVKTTGVRVDEISGFLERETGRIDLDSTNPSGLIFSDGFTAGQRLSKFAKRLFDIGASLIVLIVTLPLLIIGALCVVLGSKGPVFYRQTRVGRYGAPYAIAKLRTMRTDAEADGKAQWAQENDPRITAVGRFLRRTRIDELPQLWNVLKGEMSFVGPRPERPEFVASLEAQIPFYAERHMVKPGLTGWAQVNYPYGASVEDARAKLEYDLYYAKNYTPFLDIVILLQTLRVVLWPEGVR